MPKFNFSYDESDIKKLIRKDLEESFGISLEEKDLQIKVMSKQNYRATDWEVGKLKCDIEVKK